MTDTTSEGKQHFEVLDGLRGSAALLVVLFHIQGITVDFTQGKLLLPHAYLAVDFFFMLSGFVIAYAYDDRWARMTTLQFFRIRLIRLHPLVVLGALLGFASYLLDPFAAGKQDTTAAMLVQALLLGLVLLPARPLPNRWDDTHTLNGPSWTLLQEYLGNIAYAVALRRMGTRLLLAFALLGAAGLILCGAKLNTLDRGWGWDNFWLGTLRLWYPFAMGLWLYRVRAALPRLQLGWLPLTLVLAIAFCIPAIPASAGVSWNGLYEALCVIVLFPLVLLAGAHSHAGLGTQRLCTWSGRLSYPLYITHFPFMYVWMNYVATGGAAAATKNTIAVVLVPVVLVLAWLALRVWDEPIRAALRRRFLRRE